MSAMVEAALLYLRQGNEPFTVSARSDKAASAERPPSPQRQAEDVVEIGGDWDSPTELHVRLRVASAYHINAHEPGGVQDAALVPTRIAVEDPADSGVVIDYPDGEPLDLPFASAPVRVYDGDVTIVLRFPKPVTSDIRFSLTYQHCDDTACLPPVTKRIAVSAP